MKEDNMPIDRVEGEQYRALYSQVRQVLAESPSPAPQNGEYHTDFVELDDGTTPPTLAKFLRNDLTITAALAFSGVGIMYQSRNDNPTGQFIGALFILGAVGWNFRREFRAIWNYLPFRHTS